MEQFWKYEGGYLRGPFEAAELVAQEGFSGETMVCRFGDQVWIPAYHIKEFQDYFLVAHDQPGEVVQSGDFIPTEPPIEKTPETSKHPPHRTQPSRSL